MINCEDNLFVKVKSFNYVLDDIYNEFDVYFVDIDNNKENIKLLKSYHYLITLYIVVNSILTMYVFIKYFK
tara:strand:+ start:48 stop:260 length:213 start_codon:yes stop_codon:yes gene_type:complete